ncbi:DUF6261 family protein [Thermophagus sp. OGC60D27]|uniref:DUF6261 family protein n=1 Tax=Thermophagus sp. OGC60D27 TaxID=3458415 RepID=UPI0040380C13
MLNALNLSQLKSFDLYDLANIALHLFDHSHIYKSTLSPFVEGVRGSLRSFEETFQRHVIGHLMERKTLQASKRDEAYIAFYRFVEASCHRLSSEKTVSATQLLSVLQKHVWSPRLDGYQEKTKCLPALIRELEEKYMSLIESLGAQEWFEELLKAQADFEAISDEKKMSALKDISVRETRPMLEDSLRSLFCIVDRLYQSAPDEELGSVIFNLNQVVRKLVSPKKQSLLSNTFMPQMS